MHAEVKTNKQTNNKKLPMVSFEKLAVKNMFPNFKVLMLILTFKNIIKSIYKNNNS